MEPIGESSLADIMCEAENRSKKLKQLTSELDRSFNQVQKHLDEISQEIPLNTNNNHSQLSFNESSQANIIVHNTPYQTNLTNN